MPKRSSTPDAGSLWKLRLTFSNGFRPCTYAVRAGSLVEAEDLARKRHPWVATVEPLDEDPEPAPPLQQIAPPEPEPDHIDLQPEPQPMPTSKPRPPINRPEPEPEPQPTPEPPIGVTVADMEATVAALIALSARLEMQFRIFAEKIAAAAAAMGELHVLMQDSDQNKN